MASAKGLDFEKAIGYMDPMQVTDYLQKTLDFLQRNNNEVYFPSISPYVEAFLVNLVNDTRNLMSKSLKYEDRRIASQIIEVLEMSRDVFRWTHSYENGNLLVYRKIFSNKIKKKLAKPSSVAHRLLQAQTDQNTPNTHTPTAPAPESNHEPDIPVTTSFKLQFLNKTLRFIKDETESTLVYKEMPYDRAEYVCSLIETRDKDKDVGFGYKSLYAPLWEAMRECEVDYEFEVSLEDADGSNAVLVLEKVPKNKKSKRHRATKNGGSPESKYDKANGASHEKMSNNTRTKRKQESSKQNQPLNHNPPPLPQLELLSHINERFFKDTVVALTDFAEDEARASVAFHQLTEEEIAFVRRAKNVAESPKVREMFSPQHQDLLMRLDSSIKEVLLTCKITTTVNERDRSITLKKVPKFLQPLPVPRPSVRTGARSKSLAAALKRDRSLSKDRLIQFQKGGKLPASGNVESNTDNVASTGTDHQTRGRSRDNLNKRTAKLLEDLSTPLESDRGIRMMLLMGWNGGALGARGDGIIEPVMPAIDLPTRGGLGHVAPPKTPKATPRRPIDFRRTFLHSIYDLLLHGEDQKEVQFKDPLVKKERKFIQAALDSFNKRQSLSLSEEESELALLVAGQLAGRPGLGVRHEFSQDFRTLTLHRLTNQPVKAPKTPKPAKSRSEVVTITDDDADVLITRADAESVVPYVVVGQLKEMTNSKALMRRAVRLIFLTKFAEVMHWDCPSKIVFKFNFTIAKKLKIFIHAIIDSLNKGVWCYNLFGWEVHIYEDLMKVVQGSMLTIERLPGSKISFTKTPLTKEVPNLRENNNDDKTDNRNQVINVDDCTKHIDSDKDYSNEEKEINVFENNLENQRLIEALVKTTSNPKDAISNIDTTKDDQSCTSNEKVDLSGASVPGEGFADNSKNNRTGTIRVKDVSLINAEVDRYNLTESDKIEEVQMKIECDIAELNVKKSGMTVENDESEAKMNVLDMPELSDLDRDIQDLEMIILKADLDCVLKEENDNYCDLEMAISEPDLKIDLKKEKDLDYVNTKRTHSSSVCSQELEPKKVKISSDRSDDDEHVVIITPKNTVAILTQDMAKQVQTLMAKELEKAGGFLPLLKCHGAQNGGLVYSCHDEDDIAWIKNVISSANLDVNVVPSNDLRLCAKSRELLIKIKSFIPLDTKKIFRKFEIYNVGLDTKHWKVSYKHADAAFILFIVSVDEKSFKYISDEHFSLYCGIDKAQFTIII